MPAFDPVRDAVLNSPVEPHNPSLVSPLASPSLTRRATDLSVLLNSEPPLPAAAAALTSSRASSFSHHLVEDNKLASSEPLGRRYAGARSASSSQSQLPPRPSPVQESTPSPTVYSNGSQQFDHQRPSSSSSSSAAHKQAGGHSSGPGRRTSSPSMLPPPPPPRSGSVTGPPETNAERMRHPTSSPVRSDIPYRPTKRITRPSSVLVPLSPQEMEKLSNFQGKGALRLSTKRKRSASEDSSLPQPPAKRRAGDVGVVIDHYNSRPEVGVQQRQESPIIGLKNFNNWVKSVLITRFAHPVLARSSVGGYGQGRRGGRGKVLDMGCGKGGDITKWSKARIKELLGVDIAAVSVEQARGRYQSMDSSRFDALFAALDCYTEPLAKAFSPARLSVPFDAVSMQFCMHYAFESIQKTRMMLENVSRYLRPGGVFIGTIPNAELLMQQLDALPPDADDFSFGNDVYTIRFEQREPRPVYGHKYWFFLKDAVEDVPEYVVHWDNFVELAAEYGLYPKYKEEFHQVFDEHQHVPEFHSLMVRMKVIDADGGSVMSEDEWEAANIYIAFAFEKG